MVKPLSQEYLARIAADLEQPVSNICCICGNVIVVQIYKNSGVCNESHRKQRDDDLLPFRGGSLAP